MSLVTLPQEFKIVDGITYLTTNGAKVGDYVCLKNYHYCWVIFKFLHTNGAATTCGINRATAVAPTGATAMTEVAPIWVNLSTGVTDTLVKQTDAATYVVAGTTTVNKMVVFGIDPRALAATFDCIAATTTSNGQAGDFVGVTYLLQARYPQGTPPSAILD